MKKFTSVLVLFFCFQYVAYAQEAYADSLRDFVKTDKSDTGKVNALNQLSAFYLNSDLVESKKYAVWAKNLAFEANFGKGMAYAYKYIGLVNYYNSEYVLALNQWQRAYNIFDSIQDKVGMANMLNNIGAIYFNQGENAKALDYYLGSLRLAEESKDNLRIATAMINVGAVYFDKVSTHDLAIEYYLRALKISDELGDKEAIGAVSVNLGEIYLEQGRDTLALGYFEKSLAALDGLDGRPYSLINIGKVFVFRKDYPRAIYYFDRAKELAQSTNAKIDEARALVALADVHSKTGDKQASLKSYKKALPAALGIKANKELKDIYEGLAKTYSNVKQNDSAYKYLTLFINIKDTLFNIETDKKLNGLMFTFELERKENAIESLTKEKEVADLNIQRQALIRNIIIFAFIAAIVFLIFAVAQRNKVAKEKQRSDDLLLNILPEETANELKTKGYTTAKKIENATILFSDIKGFTTISEILSPEKLVEELDTYFRSFDNIMTKHGLEKIKTVGDGYIAAGGIPINNKANASEVILAAKDMLEAVESLKLERMQQDRPFFELRIGINSGPVVAGVVGVKKFQYDIWGDTVNTAARMEQSGEAGRINISENTFELVKHQFTCEERGMIQAKGKGLMKMYFVA